MTRNITRIHWKGNPEIGRLGHVYHSVDTAWLRPFQVTDPEMMFVARFISRTKRLWKLEIDELSPN